MSSYKSFAVIGGGTMGLPIVGALAAKNVSVVLLSRPGSASKTVPAGVATAEADFTNAAAIAAVLKKHQVDVVLSTIPATLATEQQPLVDASKLANVKLFVPSEYVVPTDGHTEGPLGEKNKTAGTINYLRVQYASNDPTEYLKSVGIPFVRIFTGLLTEFAPWLVALSDGKIKLVGKGEAPVSFTSIADVAGFVAHILTTLPPAELKDIIRLQGERASLAALGPLFNATIEHVAAIEGEKGDLKTGLQMMLGTGAGSTGWDVVNKADRTGANAAGSGNALWPGHNWKTIKEVHGL
ncbi:hypothetical protein C8R43DRAFT_892350 [Mycena crocata]|nr:hypothetical protein C8R43DRAFT_892350 [Mycena crocata]